MAPLTGIQGPSVSGITVAEQAVFQEGTSQRDVEKYTWVLKGMKRG